MPEAVILKVAVRSYMLPDQMDANGDWHGDLIQNTDGRREFPLEALLNVCEGRVQIFGLHEPIPNDVAWAYRWNPDPTNPRLEYHTGDPTGRTEPCFSIGWGKGITSMNPNQEWWTEQGEIDQPVAAMTIRVKRAGPLGFDLAMWDGDKEREEEGARVSVLRIDPYVQDNDHVWHENPAAIAVGIAVPSTLSVGPPLIIPVPVVSLPELPTGPHEGQSPQAAWDESRAVMKEFIARFCDRIPATAIAKMIRALE